MTTLGDLETALARDLRDSSNNTWSTTELGDMLNAGIAKVSELQPREIVQTIGTVASPTRTYDASSFTHIYRLDAWSSGGNFAGTLPIESGDTDTGWAFHGGVIYLPPSWMPSDGPTLQAWGYAAFTQLQATSSTTDLPTALQYSVRLYAQVEATLRLINDRTAFSQWQSDPANSDVSLLAMTQAYYQLRSRWRDEERSLRKGRKM